MVIEPGNCRQGPGRTGRPEFPDFTLKSGGDEILEEDLDLVSAPVLSGPAMRGIIEVEDGVVGEAIKERTIVTPVQGIDTVSKLPEQQPADESLASNRQADSRQD